MSGLLFCPFLSEVYIVMTVFAFQHCGFIVDFKSGAMQNALLHIEMSLVAAGALIYVELYSLYASVPQVFIYLSNQVFRATFFVAPKRLKSPGNHVFY